VTPRASGRARPEAGDHSRGGQDLRALAKDRIRFAVTAGDDTPAEVEIRLRRDRFGGWEAIALVQAPDARAPSMLARIFRSSDRHVAAGKMVARVRRRYRDACPLAEGCAGRLDLPPAARGM
jgi:hypothetical protein